MEINFNNPDFDNYLATAGFVRQDDNNPESTIFKNGGVTMTVKLFNNWKYKRRWSKLFHYTKTKQEYFGTSINFGLFGFHLLIKR